MDILFIENFRLPVSVGIYPREKAAPQMVEFSLKIGASTIEAGASDNIRDTIDYAEVVGYFQAHLSQRHFNLLESLAEFVATTLIERYGARQVRVSAAKIGAMRDVGRVGVIIERCAKTRETAELAPIDCRENGAPHAPLRASTPFSVDK